MYMYILNTNYHTSSSECIWRCVCELSMSILTLDWSTRHMTLSIHRRLHYTHTCTCTSLVPRPLPVFNDTRKKREGLVREVTCTSFRWKGDYRVWADDLIVGSACSAHGTGHWYSHQS